MKRGTRKLSSRRRRRSYAPLLFAAVVILAIAALYTFTRLGMERMQRFTVAAEAGEGGDAYEVIEASLIRPTLAQYEEFASSDSAWRRAQRERATEMRRIETVSAGIWRPSARQQMQDDVYELMQNGRLADAIQLLERWVEHNPRDRESLLTLARLLNQAGRQDESIARYRQLLAQME